HPRPVRFLEVPWLRDAWTIAKTHLWVSGMSSLVFPNAVYIVLVAGLGGCVYLTVKTIVAADDAAAYRNFWTLTAPIAFFLIAMGYFSWKNFARFREPGGAGGWYFWALALPEALLLAWGIGARKSRAAIPFFSGLFVLTVAGDIALFVEVSGKLLTAAGNRHLRGISSTPFSELWTAFVGSRP